MKIKIIGAGMAGLVAANMLRRHEVTVLERSALLPNNHTALLRFRSQAVSDATSIPFMRANVRKGLWDGKRVVNEPTIAHINRYSAIVTGGELHDRSVLNLKPVERWIAPRDFIPQMARSVKIQYNVDWKPYTYAEPCDAIISCVPMPFMMDMFKQDKPEFKYLPVWTIKATLTIPKSTVCQTLYNTEPHEWYRATLHGQEMTLEFMEDPLDEDTALGWASKAFDRFFNDNLHCDSIIEDARVNKIAIGKILPIDEKVRRAFMLYLTETKGIYSLGRFACWRNILLDDVVQDVKKIEAMMEAGNTYELRKAS